MASILSAAVAARAGAPAMAQQAVTGPLGHQRLLLAVSQPLAEREGLYVHAAGVATRAGVASPDNGPLSREEILSILVLMSIQQQPPPVSTAR